MKQPWAEISERLRRYLLLKFKLTGYHGGELGKLCVTIWASWISQTAKRRLSRMLDSAQEKLILGTCFVIAGLVLIVFHKQLRKRDDDWNARVPRFLRSHPGGPILTAMIIIFGALLIYAGIAQISNSLGN